MAISGDKKEYRNGDKVKCQQCHKEALVKWFPDKQSAIVPPGEREQLILRCQGCGFITCYSCSHPSDSMFPICPNCQREWGPYYFISGTADASGNTAAEGQSSAGQAIKGGSWQALRMDLPQTGEMYVEKNTAGSKHAGGMSSSPMMLLVFLLIGVIVAALVFILLRVPAVTDMLAGLRPKATPTSMILQGTQMVETPTLTDKQPVIIEGIIRSPVSLADCQKEPDGTEWCPALVQLHDTSTTVWIALGNPVNGLTDQLDFLDNDGSLVIPGSAIRLDGIANCTDIDTCQIRVQKITALILATITSTPTIEATQTPTLKPSATRQVSPTLAPTLTPTESACKDALKVTLDSLGEELCVQGTVSEVFKQDQAKLLLFDNQATSFIFVAYEPPMDFTAGDCVIGTGKIQQLGKRPVIVVTYKNLVKACP
jgi:hypothetical protein